jgi:hypothetical protein
MKPEPIPAVWPVLAPIPAMSAWKSEALKLLHSAKDLVCVARLSAALVARLIASGRVDLFAFVV